MSRELILFYSPDESKEDRLLQMLLMTMGFHVRALKKEELRQQVGFLAGLPGYTGRPLPSSAETSGVAERFMILCGFSRRQLNDLLAGMRRNNVPPVPLKAMLTETNSSWTAEKLYRELLAEHAFMEKQKS